MMRTTTTNSAVLSSTLLFCFGIVGIVQGDCNVDDHHPINGGYHIEGVAGFVKNGTASLDDPDNALEGWDALTNSTWATGIDYNDGRIVLCTGMFCSETCKTNGCAVLTEATTCSKVRFCYEEESDGSGSDVWMLPNESDMMNCNFDNATLICSTSEGSGDECCNYSIEEDAQLGVLYFASQTGCESGQRTAINVGDYDTVGNQCYGMGAGSSRIKSCTCGGSNTLSDPCAAQFKAGCFDETPTDDLSCCETGTCIPISKDITHETGQMAEAARQSLCMDDTPGRCSMPDENNPHDCCSKTCTECGLGLHPDSEWAPCSSGNATDSTGLCGMVREGYSYNDFHCDFSQCNDTTKWHTQSDIFQAWMNSVDQQIVTDEVVGEKVEEEINNDTEEETEGQENSGSSSGSIMFMKQPILLSIATLLATTMSMVLQC